MLVRLSIPVAFLLYYSSIPGGSVSETQKRRMNLLQKTLKEKETRLAEVAKKAQEAETAAIEKDKQVADLIFRMRQYESVCLVWVSIDRYHAITRIAGRIRIGGSGR